MLLVSATAILLAVSAAALRTPPMGFERPPALLLSTKGPAVPITIPSVPAFQLTQFPERYYKSQNGVAAAVWIKDQVSALTLSVSLYNHSWKVQPSVIARYEPITPTGQTGIVITGSHFDTIAFGGTKPEPNLNPAADDCASGSGVVFEALRTLTKNGFIPGPSHRVPLGLYGSDEIAEAYALAGTKVVSYLNLDQSGYVKAGTTPIMGILTDYTTTASTALMKNVVTTYTNLQWVASKCGYACTDNAAWYNHGYEAAIAFESSMANAFPYNDRVTSTNGFLDTIDRLDFPHIKEFVKSTIGYIVELSLTGSATTPAPSPVPTTTVAPAPATTATITVAPTLSVVVLTKIPTVAGTLPPSCLASPQLLSPSLPPSPSPSPLLPPSTVPTLSSRLLSPPPLFVVAELVPPPLLPPPPSPPWQARPLWPSPLLPLSASRL
ncbi:hypothetical protein BC829DRAFT_401371 [Chytridium lagenaria]|nr:hypothetical protein BC829DRAFT_401371 [Chytridium lagenaria]